MNYKMIADQIIKAYYSYLKNPSKPFPIIVGKYKDNIAITPDGFRAYIMPPDKCIFNLKSFLINREEIDFKKFIGSDSDYIEAYLSNDLKVVDKATVVKIKANDDVYAWVNMDYLKAYGKGVTFKVKGRKNSVLIYDNDDLIGFVLPIYVREEI